MTFQFFRQTSCATLCAFVLASGAQGSTLVLGVGGPLDAGLAIGPGVSTPGIATTFTTTSDVADISVSFGIRCFGGCLGEVVLTSALPGPKAPALSLKGLESFSVASGSSTVSGLFDGLSLVAGETYSLIVALSEGNAILQASRDPVESSPILSDGEDLMITALNGTSTFRSHFDPVPDSNGEFHYAITATLPAPAAVPLPASGLMLIASFALGAALRRKT